MTALDYVAHGLTLQVLSLLGIGGLLLSWLHDRDRRMRQEGLPNVTPGTPYRVASAEVTEAFVQTCRAIEYHLQRTALEEDWSIDWGPYHSLAEAAHSAHSSGQLRAALAEYGKAIHILAKGITQLRKQKDLAERWGVKSSGAPTPLPPTQSKTEPPQSKPDASVPPEDPSSGSPPAATK